MKKTFTIGGLTIIALLATVLYTRPAESIAGGGDGGGMWVQSLQQDCPRAGIDPPQNDICLDWTERANGRLFRFHSCCLTEGDINTSNMDACGGFRHDH